MNAIKKFKSFFLAESILLLILGIILFILPQIATFAISMVLSCTMLFLGLYKLINSISLWETLSKPFVQLCLSLFLLGTAIYLFLNPAVNAMILTVIIGVYLILEAVHYILLGFKTRELFKLWWVNAILSVLQIILGLYVLLTLKSSSETLIGIIFSINLIFTAIAQISLYIESRIK